MAKSARVVGGTFLSRGRFDLTRTEIEVVEDDGATRTLSHEVYRHGQAAAVLLYDPARSVVTLVRQFRAGAFLCDGAQGVPIRVDGLAGRRVAGHGARSTIRTGARAQFREAESSRIPGVGDARRASPRAFDAF